MKDAIIKKCQEFGLTVKEKDENSIEVFGATGKHVIFWSDIPHIEAWEANQYRDINHSDWIGSIDTLDSYLVNI